MIIKRIVVFCALMGVAMSPIHTKIANSSLVKKTSFKKSVAPAITKSTAASIKNTQQVILPWPDVLDEVKDAVVQIFSYSSPFNFQTPFKRDALTRSSGSGFFVMLDGVLSIITNYHVIDKADIIYLQHPNAWKECIELEFVGGSPEFDIALLRFKPGQQALLEQKLGDSVIKTLELGNSDKVRQGEEIMLIGYPLGEEHVKHAVGTISGHESIHCGECFTTTAAAFPGNSGGACVSQAGQVIGILVAGIASSQGLNYVLPISREKVVLKELENGRVLERPFWGLVGQSTTPETFEYFNVPGDGGLLVTKVEPDSLFSKAGLQKNDVITAIMAFDERMPVDRFGYVAVPWSSYKMEFFDVLGRIYYGNTFELEYWRDGQLQTLQVTKTFDNPFQVKRKSLPFDQEPAYEIFAGCVVMEFTMNHYLQVLPRLKSYLNACSPDLTVFTKLAIADGRKEPKLLISHVFPESGLAKNHVFEGPLNILEKVNGQQVRTIADYRDAMQKSLETGYIVFEGADGITVVLKMADVIQQELTLAEKYNYQPSGMFLKMVM